MNFAEYQSRVIKDYRQKKAKNSLIFTIPHPTTARIRNACIDVLETRFERKDESFIRRYFKVGVNNDFILAVKKLGVDKYRPLINFLNEESKSTDVMNIELLAWLIDFPERPHQWNYTPIHTDDVQATPVGSSVSAELEEVSNPPITSSSDPSVIHPVPEEAKAVAEIEAVKMVVPPTDEPEVEERSKNHSQEKVGKTLKKKAQQYGVAIVLILMLVAVVLRRKYEKPITMKPVVSLITGRNGCVIWVEDHYQAASCEQQIKGLFTPCLDSGTVAHLSKITRPDTITTKAFGHVWYVKIKGQLTYYTAPGFDPVYRDLRLKPLTLYIYNKYLFHYADKTSEQMSVFQQIKDWLTFWNESKHN
ncbi:hypothetical protein HH214_07445 [Mucilaginibacter robiniae]|uniref:Uncharacterized protein n=1 Tax=Mucilaginibacter robiniae TaxID=2728022 RepID=A0A7L5E034_9SPHI|nr:hypothetical protein [Mucilaginibacter robiniae]QJD95717.1 hypothetical protein HH214_07445 [Mucilaginibacter robiniae]